MGDLIIQYWDSSYLTDRFITHLVETKADKKKKFTKSQEDNALHLCRVDCRKDVFELLIMDDWELD